MSKFVPNRMILIPMMLFAVWTTGCSDQGRSKNKLKQFEGTANSIDLQSKEVSMTVVREDGSEHDLKGIIRDDTEVWINGRQRSLEDVKKGDKVRAFVLKDKSEGKYVVVKVEVDRPISKNASADGADVPDESGASPAVMLAKSPDPSVETAATPDRSTMPVSDQPPKRDSIRDREHAEDMIYGQIRLRMEIALEKRKDLLASGAGRADPQVRDLERQIGKARELLIEHGEIVGEFEPPM